MLIYIEIDNNNLLDNEQEEYNGLCLLNKKGCFNITDNFNDANIIYYLSINENNKIKMIHNIFNVKNKNKLFILGPNIDKFPSTYFKTLKNIYNNVFINLTSDWNINLWKNIYNYNNIPLIKLPIPIDSEKFNNNNRNITRTCFIYINNNRKHEDYYDIIELFAQLEIEVIYINKSILNDEEQFINIIKKCLFGLWIGIEEIQNIKILQILSYNIPMMIYDIENIDIQNHTNIYSTSIPYWDNKCGEIFYNKNDFPNCIRTFLPNIKNYTPRQYILDNFTEEIIFNNYWKDILHNIKV